MAGKLYGHHMSAKYVMLDCVWTLALNYITQKRTLSKPTTVYRNKMWKAVTLTEMFRLKFHCNIVLLLVMCFMDNLNQYLKII